MSEVTCLWSLVSCLGACWWMSQWEMNPRLPHQRHASYPLLDHHHKFQPRNKVSTIELLNSTKLAMEFVCQI